MRQSGAAEKGRRPLPVRRIRIFKERAGVIGPKACWVCFAGPYMHTGDTLLALLIATVKEWRSDSCLVG